MKSTTYNRILLVIATILLLLVYHFPIELNITLRFFACVSLIILGIFSWVLPQKLPTKFLWGDIEEITKNGKVEYHCLCYFKIWIFNVGYYVKINPGYLYGNSKNPYSACARPGTTTNAGSLGLAKIWLECVQNHARNLEKRKNQDVDVRKLTKEKSRRIVYTTRNSGATLPYVRPFDESDKKFSELINTNPEDKEGLELLEEVLSIRQQA